MFEKIKNIFVTAIPAVIILVFCGILIFGQPNKYSESERRTLAQKPEISAEKLKNGEFMSSFETWGQDQFPMRDTFRKIKTIVSVKVFGQKDNHGLYNNDKYLSKMEYPADNERIDKSLEVLNSVYSKYIKDTNCKTYLSVISDKNRYLAPLDNHMTMDYDEVNKKIAEGMNFAKYIDISDALSLEDFYYTDQHWKQENIIPVAQTLAKGLGVSFKDDFVQKKVDDVYLLGAYVGQYGLGTSYVKDFKGDELNYLTDEAIENATVKSFATGQAKESVMYNMNKAKGKDAYEFFLSGSEPLLMIENPNAETDRELVIFRDSFTSSLAPLLTQSYSKITLIDMRYMRADLIGNYLSFENQDVLFLYSTLILNNSIA